MPRIVSEGYQPPPDKTDYMTIIRALIHKHGGKVTVSKNEFSESHGKVLVSTLNEDGSLTFRTRDQSEW